MIDITNPILGLESISNRVSIDYDFRTRVYKIYIRPMSREIIGSISLVENVTIITIPDIWIASETISVAVDKLRKIIREAL